MSKKDIQEIAKDAIKRGWEITLTNGQHLKWLYSNGLLFFSASTPSDRRAINNIEAQIRRIENNIEPR